MTTEDPTSMLEFSLDSAEPSKLLPLRSTELRKKHNLCSHTITMNGKTYAMEETKNLPNEVVFDAVGCLSVGGEAIQRRTSCVGRAGMTLLGTHLLVQAFVQMLCAQVL